MQQQTIVTAFRESMIALMKLLKEETGLLKKREFASIDKLQSRKRQLAMTYEQHQAEIRKNPSAIQALGQDERRELRDLYKRFRCALSDNMLALRSSHDATERVVKLIVEAVRKQRGGTGAPPTFGRPKRGYAAYGPIGTGGIAVSQHL